MTFGGGRPAVSHVASVTCRRQVASGHSLFRGILVPSCAPLGQTDQEMPDDKSAPTRALAIAVETRIDLHKVEAGDRGGAACQSRTCDNVFANKPDRVRSANAWYVEDPNRIRV